MKYKSFLIIWTGKRIWKYIEILAQGDYFQNARRVWLDSWGFMFSAVQKHGIRIWFDNWACLCMVSSQFIYPSCQAYGLQLLACLLSARPPCDRNLGSFSNRVRKKERKVCSRISTVDTIYYIWGMRFFFLQNFSNEIKCIEIYNFLMMRFFIKKTTSSFENIYRFFFNDKHPKNGPRNQSSIINQSSKYIYIYIYRHLLKWEIS